MQIRIFSKFRKNFECKFLDECNFFFSLQESVSQWRVIFFLTAGIYVIGALAFVLFGSVKVQPWNDPTMHKNNSRLYGFPEVPSIPESLKDTKVNEKEEKIER